MMYSVKLFLLSKPNWKLSHRRKYFSIFISQTFDSINEGYIIHFCLPKMVFQYATVQADEYSENPIFEMEQ